jgi:hypothetical protein
MTSEIEKYFNEYILPPNGLVYSDIKREIDLAHAGRSGGAILSALGLLSYTEFMGKIMLKKKESYTKQFKAFLSFMGDEYKRLLDDKEIDVYKLSRSGMVQACFGNDCTIEMLNNDKHPCGIIIQPDGTYLFIVEKYFEDFMSACQRLSDDIDPDEEDEYLPS